jgi:ATP-dependent DNA helicase MPH1
MSRTYIQELASEKHDGVKKQDEKLRSNPKFQAVMKEVELQYTRGLTVHPKMEKLKELLIQHFGGRIDEDGEETRAMVFVTYRECVDEIVDMLDADKPLIRATRFVGQGIDKQGKKGYGQKEQLEVKRHDSLPFQQLICSEQVINKFKAGQFNVLVATSVGEEGLDIGEIDLIICYDAQKTPIRMVRFSRPGAFTRLCIPS